MAKTSKNNIYYNDDENSIADVLTDMKEMVESIDEAMENAKYDDTQLKQNISEIEEEQKTQDNKIIELQKENAELQSENARLKQDLNSLPSKQVTGEIIDITDSAEIRFNEFKVMGNSKQDEEPSPDYPSEVESCGDNGCINEVVGNKNLLDTSAIQIIKNQNEESRNGYYCKIPKTGKYYLMLNTTNIMYFGKSTNINSASTLIGSTSSTFSTFYDFNEGEYFVLWGTETDTDKIMVVLSDKQEDYVEHQSQTFTIPTQQPMRAIGDYKDAFIKVDGKWFERHYINRVTFDGTENWIISKYSGWNNAGYLYATLVNDGMKSNYYPLKSNYYKNCGNIYNEDIDNGITNYYTFEKNIWILDKRFNSLDDFKSELSTQYNEGTPLYVDYILATPTDLECTEEQNKILDELENAKSYKGVTHIYSTDEVEPYVEVTYKKDMQIENEKLQSQIDEIKQLLSTTRTSALLLDNLQTDIESEVE